MGALYAASSVHSFFNNKDSNPTHRCCSHSIKQMRICILYMIFKVAVVATHATIPPELYWKSMLPTSPIPKSIAALLHPAGDGTTVHGGSQIGENVSLAAIRFCYGTGARYCGPKRPDDPNTNLFFLEKDLKFGHTKNFLFEKTSNQASFLPRQVVKSIPFSSTKMAKILNKFAVKPGSIKAEVMENTIKLCEESAIKGEDKYCATSLEPMLDFINSKLGKNVDAFYTEVMKNITKRQEYKVTNKVKKMVETCNILNFGTRGIRLSLD